MRIPRVLPGIVLALLGGCTVGPDFVAPKPETPAGWVEPVADTAPAGDAAWWRSFADPTLTSLTERAAAGNLDLARAVLRIDEARAQREITGAAQFPSLSGTGGYTRQRISEKTAETSLLGGIGNAKGAPTGPIGGVGSAIPGLQNPFGQFQYGFDASWEVDLFGRVRRSVEAADAETDASVEDSRDVLVSLQAEVARFYIDLRAAQRRAAILAQSLATAQGILDLARERRTAELGNDLDVVSAAAQVSATEAQRPAVDSLITTDINQLSQLLGLPPGALRHELEDPAAIPPVPPAVPVGLPADLLRRRPDIRTAEARLHAATARVGVAVADLFPRLTLDADVGFQAQHAGDLSNWASRFFSVGPSLDVPIFSGGQRQATVRLQTATAKEAGLAYASAVLASVHEVENALAAYGSEQRRRTALEVNAAWNRDALVLARQRYDGGVIGFLDVLDAERSLQQTELALADSQAAVSTDLVALYKALGGGWQVASPIAASPAGNQ